MLTVEGRQLSGDAKWVWYNGLCGGSKKEGEGPVLIINNFSKTAIYYVRAEYGSVVTPCVYKKVSIDNTSRPADRIAGVEKICASTRESVRLVVEGGRKGLGAQWVWYKNKCDIGERVGYGDTIYVRPEATTTYYVRAESATYNTICASHQIEVELPPAAPEKIEAVNAPT